jgi:hypothetical protein
MSSFFTIKKQFFELDLKIMNEMEKDDLNEGRNFFFSISHTHTRIQKQKNNIKN